MFFRNQYFISSLVATEFNIDNFLSQLRSFYKGLKCVTSLFNPILHAYLGIKNQEKNREAIFFRSR